MAKKKKTAARKKTSARRKESLHPERKRLRDVFDSIEAHDKIMIREDYCGTYSSAFSQIHEELVMKKNRSMIGFALYTQQHTDRAMENGRLVFGYGSRDEDDLDVCRQIGRTVVKRLVAAGFDADWDVDAADGTIWISGLSKESLPNEAEN